METTNAISAQLGPAGGRVPVVDVVVEDGSGSIQLREIVRCSSDMRRTRILSTLGPASDGPDQIRALLEAGTDAFRLNFSHGTHDGHADVCRRIRDVSAQMGRAVSVLQDLAGPKIRIGKMAAPLTLTTGDHLTIEHGDFVGGPGRVSCASDALFASVSSGARLLVDEGRIELEVTHAAANRIETRVLTGGDLDSNKGINVPSAVQTSALTPKDADDLRAGIAMGVDLVAISFVQTADDLRQVRAAARAAGAPDLPIIAKIEKPQAVDRIDEILLECEGLMVARGDLGIEMPLEALPAVQRLLIRAARARGVPVIVATQVLESMRSSPRPTRAEVTDAAHAVDQGADAIMLAGETAIGQYAELAVATLDRIILEAEKTAPLEPPPEILGFSEHGHALCEAAVALAARAGAVAIVAVTEGGRTARMLSALRPRARILAATPNASTAARLALVWGVTPLVADGSRVEDLRIVLRNRDILPAGAVVVFVSMDSALDRDDANFVHVERL
jgi:pyruvate kinase